MAQTKTSPAKKKSPAKSARAKAAPKKAAKSAAKPAAKAKPKKKAAPKKKPAKKAGDKEVTVDRRLAADRRDEIEAEAQADAAPKLERRQKVNRRRQIDPTTCERDYSDAEVEFMNALDAYKRSSGRMFPTCSEVLEVIRGMGYVQLSPAEQAAIREQRGETEPEPGVEDQAAAEAEEALAESEALRVD